MKYIVLTQGYLAVVDDEDFARLNKHRWYANKIVAGGQASLAYGVRAFRQVKDPITKKRKNIYMSRAILDCPKGLEVDHVNHNSLDNRKANLRICTHSENLFNRRKISSKNYFKVK